MRELDIIEVIHDYGGAWKTNAARPDALWVKHSSEVCNCFDLWRWDQPSKYVVGIKAPGRQPNIMIWSSSSLDSFVPEANLPRLYKFWTDHVIDLDRPYIDYKFKVKGSMYCVSTDRLDSGYPHYAAQNPERMIQEEGGYLNLTIFKNYSAPYLPPAGIRHFISLKTGLSNGTILLPDALSGTQFVHPLLCGICAERKLRLSDGIPQEFVTASLIETEKALQLTGVPETRTPIDNGPEGYDEERADLPNFNEPRQQNVWRMTRNTTATAVMNPNWTNAALADDGLQAEWIRIWGEGEDRDLE